MIKLDKRERKKKSRFVKIRLNIFRNITAEVVVRVPRTFFSKLATMRFILHPRNDERTNKRRKKEKKNPYIHSRCRRAASSSQSFFSRSGGMGFQFYIYRQLRFSKTKSLCVLAGTVRPLAHRRRHAGTWPAHRPSPFVVNVLFK